MHCWNQSAFVPERFIRDNIFVAHELCHYLKSTKNCPNKGDAIKLDMEKAYNRVEWNFLVAVILKMEFAQQWVDMILSCVTYVSFCFRINGATSDFFSPSKGLRQGDPFFPYLFLFCM
ncbi:hypothetical protein GQ457_12G017320 [Hibiscus cannabinus]